MAGQTLAEVAAEAGEALLGEGGGAEFPLLVKLLFPNDKLSVQVHPDDAQAQAMGQPRGKTECWYVLEAEPGATIALGLKPGATADAVRAAIAAGTLEEWMEWVPGRSGRHGVCGCGDGACDRAGGGAAGDAADLRHYVPHV